MHKTHKKIVHLADAGEVGLLLSLTTVWRSYSKGEFRSIIGSSIIGIWAISREMGLIEIGTYRIFYNFMVEDGQYMCKSRTKPRDGSNA